MSELFNYLQRRRDNEIRAVPAASHLQPASATTTGFNSVLDDRSDVTPELPMLMPDKPDIKGNGTINLNSADYRVKNVLDPVTAVGEQFRLLRAKLSLEQRQKGTKILLITSAAPGEGKTFTSCSLAGVLAQEPGKRVLLIDADMRRPMASKDFGISGLDAKGLSNVLRGEIMVTDALLSSPDSTLFLLPSGDIPSNPSELLSSPRLETSLKGVVPLFDWVIIDSPPVDALADTSVIAPLCDAVLLIIQADKTNTKMILGAIERIGRDKICGVVMNRAKFMKKSQYYYKYYSAHPPK